MIMESVKYTYRLDTNVHRLGAQYVAELEYSP